MITFYDVPSQLPEPWSPINWTIRLILKYKSLRYETEWIEYPDIESFSKSHNIPPTGKKPDGSPFYTLPAIYDDTTGVYMANSLPIAKYLDTTYPRTPVVVPLGTEGLVKGFLHAYMAIPFLRLVEVLNPASAKYFSASSAVYFGAPIVRRAQSEHRENALDNVRRHMEEVARWYESTTGRFVMGDTPIFVDFVIATTILGMRILFGVDSELWMEVCVWDGGRWGKLVEYLEGLCNAS